jgi:hypothetical protein
MKSILMILLATLLYACNDNATAPKHSLDNTDNDDTQPRVTDTLNAIDSLRGR